MAIEKRTGGPQPAKQRCAFRSPRMVVQGRYKAVCDKVAAASGGLVFPCTIHHSLFPLWGGEIGELTGRYRPTEGIRLAPKQTVETETARRDLHRSHWVKQVSGIKEFERQRS